MILTPDFYHDLKSFKVAVIVFIEVIPGKKNDPELWSNISIKQTNKQTNISPSFLLY